jgi:MFS family permease
LLVDRLVKQGRDASAVRQAVLIGGMSLGICVVAPTFVSDARVVLICLSLGISGLSMASPVVWSLPALLAPNSAGRVGGIMNFSNQVAGTVAPIVTGYITAMTHSFAGAFLVAAVILVLGIASYVALLGRIERIALPASALA